MTKNKTIVDSKPGQRAIPFTFAGDNFIARGDGPRSEIVVRSIARRVANNGVNLWPGNESGQYRAQWYDPEQEIFCEAEVTI